MSLVAQDMRRPDMCDVLCIFMPPSAALREILNCS